jgi:S-DNA-T family DNA segregation ATPase FtsK/SpoIIIE
MRLGFRSHDDDEDAWKAVERIRALPEIAAEQARAVNPVRPLELVKTTDRPVSRPDDNEVADKAGPPVGLPTPGRRPLLPEWAKNPKATAAWAVNHVAFWTAFHALRLPGNLGRAAAYTPRGASRAIGSLTHWATDRETAPLRRASVAGLLYAEHRDLDRRRRDKVKKRGPVAAAVTGCAAIAIYAGATAPSWPVKIATVLAVILAGGWHGRPEGEPLFEPAIITNPKARRITTDMITAALVAAKLGKADEITFLAAPVPADGGWRCVFDVPPGKVFADALKKRDVIAGALNAKGVQLVLEETEDSQRRVMFWLCNEDPYAGKSKPNPLVGRGRRYDIWKGVPFGVNARGKPVVFPLLFTGVLIGSIPRMGKTVAVRNIMVPCLLDPDYRFYQFDGKGGVDMMPSERCAHRHGAGTDPATVALLRQSMEEAVADAKDRNARLRALPRRDCPEGKLTPELARNRSLNMPATGIFVDEVHLYLADSVHGVALGALFEELAKVAPSVGYSLVLATQRPNAKTMDDGLRGSLGTRFALKVMNRRVSGMILGDTDGYDASTLQRKHKGVGILLGADDGELADEPPQTVLAYHTNVADFEQVCDQAFQIRKAAGTLSGMAAGEVPVLSAEWRLLDDVTEAFHAGDVRLSWQDIIANIGEVHPERAVQWSPQSMSRACGAIGLKPVQINRGDSNLKGLTRASVDQLVAKRAQEAAEKLAENDQAISDDETNPSDTASDNE